MQVTSKDKARGRTKNESMLLLGMIADHPTPKINVGGGTAYTQNSRDYKGVMIVVISEDNRPADGEFPSGELLRTGRIQRYVCNGEEK